MNAKVRTESPVDRGQTDKTNQAISSLEESMAQADTQRLYEVAKQAVTDRAEIAKAFNALVAVWSKDSQAGVPFPLAPPTENAIAAMQAVALAAIELAKLVATLPIKPRGER